MIECEGRKLIKKSFYWEHHLITYRIVIGLGKPNNLAARMLRDWLTWLRRWLKLAAFAIFSLDRALDRSAILETRKKSCWRSAILSLCINFMLVSLLRLSVSSRTTCSKPSHSWVCRPQNWDDSYICLYLFQLNKRQDWHNARVNVLTRIPLTLNARAFTAACHCFSLNCSSICNSSAHAKWHSWLICCNLHFLLRGLSPVDIRFQARELMELLGVSSSCSQSTTLQ